MAERVGKFEKQKISDLEYLYKAQRADAAWKVGMTTVSGVGLLAARYIFELPNPATYVGGAIVLYSAGNAALDVRRTTKLRNKLNNARERILGVGELRNTSPVAQKIAASGGTQTILYSV